MYVLRRINPERRLHCVIVTRLSNMNLIWLDWLQYQCAARHFITIAYHNTYRPILYKLANVRFSLNEHAINVLEFLEAVDFLDFDDVVGGNVSLEHSVLHVLGLPPIAVSAHQRHS